MFFFCAVRIQIASNDIVVVIDTQVFCSATGFADRPDGGAGPGGEGRRHVRLIQHCSFVP